MTRTTHGALTSAGEAGIKVINDFDLHVINASMIQLSSDAVVTVLKVDGGAANVVTDYISTPANATGACSISAVGSKAITSIQLSAGTCNYAI